MKDQIFANEETVQHFGKVENLAKAIAVTISQLEGVIERVEEANENELAAIRQAIGDNIDSGLSHAQPDARAWLGEVLQGVEKVPFERELVLRYLDDINSNNQRLLSIISRLKQIKFI